MEFLKAVCQVTVGLGILNVWLLRSNKATDYRGGQATNLKEEFRAYGLPDWFFYGVGLVKVPAAIVLLLGLVFPVLAGPAAVVIAVLMLGAVLLHVRVQDAPKKFVPATSVLVLCLLIVFL